MSVRALIGLDYLATVAAAGLWVAAAFVLASRAPASRAVPSPRGVFRAGAAPSSGVASSPAGAMHSRAAAPPAGGTFSQASIPGAGASPPRGLASASVDRRGARRRIAGVALVFGAAAVTLARLLLVAGLARAGWPYAQEKVLLSVPLLAIPAAVAVEWFEQSDLFVRVAACGAVAGVVVAFGVGYPAGIGNGTVIVTATLAAVALVLRRWRVPALLLLALAIVLSFHTPALHDHGRTTDVSALRLSTVDAPVRRFGLTASHVDVSLPGGRNVAALGFNHRVPGEEIRVEEGDIVEVTLRNQDVEDGVTLHWHGYPVPNGDDGVAGLTQNAVMPGGEYVYRFRATKTGTYWYHTHQVSHRGVKLGLFGVFVVTPHQSSGVDQTVVLHTLSGKLLPVGPVVASPGTLVRLRVVNTDDGGHRIALRGTPWRLSAVDGTDLSGPTPVVDKAVAVPAGGRADLTFEMPAGQLVIATDPAQLPTLDLLNYGTPGPPPPSAFDRAYTVVLDRQFRLVGKVPQYAYTINGQVWPATPTLDVRQGDLVKLTIVNRDKEAHPMHPHGHQVRVLSVDGQPVRGSPMWTDSFQVGAGQTWEVALEADNPGLWMFHCHNLPHAAKGMMLHLAYPGVFTRYQEGADNHPE